MNLTKACFPLIEALKSSTAAARAFSSSAAASGFKNFVIDFWREATSRPPACLPRFLPSWKKRIVGNPLTPCSCDGYKIVSYDEFFEMINFVNYLVISFSVTVPLQIGL